MVNLSKSLSNIIGSLKIIPEPFSVDGIVHTFSISMQNEELVDNFSIHFSKNNEASLWYHSKNYRLSSISQSDIGNVINTKNSKKIDNIKIYPLVARNICFGAITIEAKEYVLESKRFSALIDYFSLILYTEKLSFQANKDKLTSLYNRGYILQLLNRYKYDSKEYAVIIIDLDKFKHYNDKYGHNTGDYILKLASSKMQQCIKSLSMHATLARYGGEEFIVVADITAKEDIKNIMELLRSTIEVTDFSTDDYALRVTMSLGGAISLKSEDVHETINRADKALYNSKNSGRNKSSIS